MGIGSFDYRRGGVSRNVSTNCTDNGRFPIIANRGNCFHPLGLKGKNIRFYRNSEEDAYCYEFPGHSLSMTIQPYWLSIDMDKPVTKVTLRVLTAKNEAFAKMLAESIDEMAEQRANS